MTIFWPFAEHQYGTKDSSGYELLKHSNNSKTYDLNTHPSKSDRKKHTKGELIVQCELNNGWIDRQGKWTKHFSPKVVGTFKFGSQQSLPRSCYSCKRFLLLDMGRLFMLRRCMKLHRKSTVHNLIGWSVDHLSSSQPENKPLLLIAHSVNAANVTRKKVRHRCTKWFYYYATLIVFI